MNIRYAKPIDKDQVVSVWNYCFEDGEDFVKYYFENVYDENNAYESKLYKVGEKKHILHNQRKS